jgi:hypothetical protein
MATAASKAARKSKVGKLHEPDYSKIYSQKHPPLDLASQEFRIWAIRPDQGPMVPIGPMVDSVSWRYEVGNPVRLGDVNLRRPDPVLFPGFRLVEGHQIKLDCRWGGLWREVWRMRLGDGKLGLDGAQTFSLADDGLVLQLSRDDWHYGKSKARPKGWRCHEILKDIAKRYRIPLGAVTAGTHYISTLSLTNQSPMQVIQKAYSIERSATGRSFVVKWVHGKLSVVPLQRNPLLYILGPQLQSALVGKEARDEKFATAVTVHSTVKGGKRKGRKITETVVNKDAVKREGFVHQRVEIPRVTSVADARSEGKRYMARHSVRKRTIENLTHYGIAFVSRGDAVRVSIPQSGVVGDSGVLFVSDGQWSLDSAGFTMSLGLKYTDPVFSIQKQAQEAKDAAARQAKRTKKK